MVDEFYVPPEAKAYQAFLRWLDEGKKVWDLFDGAGVSVPETLRRALTDSNAKQGAGGNQQRRSSFRPPDKPTRPPQAHDDWLWIPAAEASLSTVVLAILNEGKPLPVKELIARVKSILPDAVEGSIYNTGAQNQAEIQKNDGVWSLKSGANVPILSHGYVWAPPDLLLKQDLAAFRRMAILHLLGIRSDGMQVMQIFKELEGANWLTTPKSKDLIKADLFIMREKGKVKRSGNQKKWKLT